MYALLLGAGFSKWAADLPVAGGLFDYAIQTLGQRDEIKLQSVKALKEDWDRRNPGSGSEQFIAYALGQSEQSREVMLWYIVRRLSEPFICYSERRGQRRSFMLDENWCSALDGVVKARDFLKRFASHWLEGVITTNYDMLVEYALGSRGFNYGIQGEILYGRTAYVGASQVTLRGLIKLAKIHGSVSWDENKRYTEGRRGITGGALIVAPTPEKRPPDPLMRDWDLAKSVLNGTKKLAVFGFAFNPYDEAVLDLLRSNGSDLQSVLVIDINPQVARVQALYPSAQVVGCQPPPAGDAVITSWLQ